MNYYHSTKANPHIYCVLCGRMTPKQKDIARQRASLDTKKLLTLLTWFATESGHAGFEGVSPPAECPVPTVLEEPDNQHNTDLEINPEVEQRFDGATFHFSSANDPDTDTGVYGSSQNFLKAMLEKTMPTLLVQGGSFANFKEVMLENIAAVQFPFGLGGPTILRRNHVSPLECYRHYCRLSPSQFMRGDFLLILNHMQNRYLSYQTAMIKCRSSSRGTTLAEKVSTLSMKDLTQAASLTDSGHRVSGTAGDFL